MLARFGGDEFVVLLPGITSEADALGVADRLADGAARAVRRSTASARFVTASVGMSFSAAGERRPEALLRDADAAMYHAKERARRAARSSTTRMRERALERLELESGLRHALDAASCASSTSRSSSLADGRITGVEALLRWDHPVLGLVAPRASSRSPSRTG